MSKQLRDKSVVKNIIYLLIGIIFLLIILLSYFVFNSLDNKQTNSIENQVTDYKRKFNTDSINLVKKNKLLIDNISQNIIDSLTLVYENKLQTTYQKDLKLSSKSLKNKKKSKNTVNPATYNKRPNTRTRSTRSTSNVTTYTKLKNYNPNTYTKPTRSTSNVTTYTKLKNYNPNVSTKPTKSNSNPTTNAKLKNYKPKSNVLNSTKANSVISNNNSRTSVTKNINNVETSPVFPGCENKTSEMEKKNCLALKISNHIIKNFNSKKFKNLNLKKGINNIRVLFIIDKYGNCKTTNIIGNWHQEVKQEVNKVINSIPKMKPGKSNKIEIPVKYSYRISFIVK